VLLGELSLLGFAVALLLVSLRVVWPLLRSVVLSMAGSLELGHPDRRHCFCWVD